MYNPDTELLFPIRVIPILQKLRGEKWYQLVVRMTQPNPKIEDQLGFVLMMIRLDGCITCNTHSFRAMRGCVQCAQQAVRRFKGSDEELVEIFDKTRDEVENYLHIRQSKNV